MPDIASRHNALVTRFRDAARGRGDTAASLLLDGPHLVSTALDSGARLEVVAVEAGALDEPGSEISGLVQRLQQQHVRTVTTTRAVLEAMSPVRTPSGVVGLAARPEMDPLALLYPAPALIIVVVGVQDPGNVGSIVRAADAAGATGVIVTTGSADPFGWKALRGSMGSTLRMPVWAGVSVAELQRYLHAHDVWTVATVTNGGPAFDVVDLRRPVALMVGSEGQGLPAELIDWAAERIHVPMRPGVDSLNVAVTAALLLYEARRQRAEARSGKRE